jgi:hypothetical protein
MIVASRWWLEERVGVSAGTPTNDAGVQLYHFT